MRAKLKHAPSSTTSAGPCGMDPEIPPSISKLFRTNAVPSPMDAQHIHQLLKERRAALSVFAEQVAHARAQVERLEDQHDQAKSVVLELEALASPIRRIPTDIMAKVFEHCVWDQATLKADPRVAPLLLAQVCHSWRHLLFSLPCLWTTFRLDLPSGTKDWGTLIQSKSLSMHLWLSRSKGLPISLFLSHARAGLVPWHALIHYDQEILTLSCRLKHLSLHFPSRSLSCLLTFTQNSLPHLEHLELRSINSLPTNENPPPIVLRSAPSLKSLSLSWCSLDLCNFQVPWAQLQHLSLEYHASPFWNPVHSDYLQTLARCPSLITLSLGIGASIDDVDATHIVPVTLPHVHTFKSTVYVQTPYIQYLFDAIRMPQLRHFEIHNVSPLLGSFTGQTECLPFLERCADTLESLSFNRIDIPDSAVLSCLTHLCRLKTLHFLPGILRINHGLVTALALDNPSSNTEDGQICPTLEALHLRCSSVVPVEAITHLVASRCQATPPLKQFSLQLATFEYGSDTRDDKIEQAHAQLVAYVKEGLQLDLSKSSDSR